MSYNYGNVQTARLLARKVLRKSEAALKAAEADAVIVGDCSSCVAHLKAYPQLFLDQPEWKARAEAFAARVRDIVELLPQIIPPRYSPPPLEGASDGTTSPPAAYPPAGGAKVIHDSCRARHGQGLVGEPREALQRLAGSTYAELPEADVCCGGAGAFSFLQPELSDTVLRRKVGAIASVQARVVAVSSTSCWLQLAEGLRRYYPECRVAHLSELAAEGLEILS